MVSLPPIVAALQGEGRLRVWSLVITAFGDCVQHRGGSVTSAQMQALLAPLDIDPGAVRTAMSRLVRDGWLERSGPVRQGRYRLSQKGQDAFSSATARIYEAPRQDTPADWCILVQSDPPEVPSVRLAEQTWLLHRPAAHAKGSVFTISDAVAAPAFRADLLSADQRNALVALAADLEALRTAAPKPEEAAAARIALIHRWRRYILRYPELPLWLAPDDSPLADPRTAVGRAYRMLVDPAEAHLDALGLSVGDLATLDMRFA